MLSIYQPASICFRLFQIPPALQKVKSASIKAKTGQKLIFICSVLSHPRIFGDNKRQKPKIFLKCGRKVGAWDAFPACLSSCPLMAGGRGCSCYFADVSKIGQDNAGYSAFCPLYCFVFGWLLADMPLFSVLRGFLEGFGGFVWVCVALVLCVACVAFVCVWS